MPFNASSYAYPTTIARFPRSGYELIFNGHVMTSQCTDDAVVAGEYDCCGLGNAIYTAHETQSNLEVDTFGWPSIEHASIAKHNIDRTHTHFQRRDLKPWTATDCQVVLREPRLIAEHMPQYTPHEIYSIIAKAFERMPAPSPEENIENIATAIRAYPLNMFNDPRWAAVPLTALSGPMQLTSWSPGAVCSFSNEPSIVEACSATFTLLLAQTGLLYLMLIAACACYAYYPKSANSTEYGVNFGLPLFSRGSCSNNKLKVAQPIHEPEQNQQPSI